MPKFQLFAAEPLTDDIFGPEVADAMKLPFDRGWDSWIIFQKDVEIARFENYTLAASTCAALNMIGVLDHAYA